MERKRAYGSEGEKEKDATDAHVELDSRILSVLLTVSISCSFYWFEQFAMVLQFLFWPKCTFFILPGGEQSISICFKQWGWWHRWGPDTTALPTGKVRGIESLVMNSLWRELVWLVREGNNFTMCSDICTPFMQVHSKNFNVGIQALMHLDKISSKNQIVSDRFYRALYSKLLLPAAMNSSKASDTDFLLSD